MKKIVSIALTLMLLLTFTTTAFATDDPPLAYSSVPTEGIPASGSTGGAEGHQLLSLMTTTDIAPIAVYIWRNAISEISSGYLKLSGLTETDMLADRVDLNFTLQQWNGSSWVTYSTSNNYDLITEYLNLSIYRYVAHGYYYRVKTVHKGTLDGYTDERTLYSSYIYVS